MPMPNVALVNDSASGAHVGHIDVKNEGNIARNPQLFLWKAMLVLRLCKDIESTIPDRIDIMTIKERFGNVHKSYLTNMSRQRMRFHEKM